MKTLTISLVLGSMVLSSCDSAAIGPDTSIDYTEDDVQVAVETTEAVPESYQYEAYEDEDKPFAGISRRSVAIEIKEYPIDETRLLATLAAIADNYQGETNAISVRAHWDRRESEPSFGVWVWAPEGDWAKAVDGDSTDWDNYLWKNGLLIEKIANPEGCDLPIEEDLEVNQAFNEGYSRTDLQGEEKDRAIAAELGITPEEYGAAIARVSDWASC